MNNIHSLICSLDLDLQYHAPAEENVSVGNAHVTLALLKSMICLEEHTASVMTFPVPTMTVTIVEVKISN